MAFIITGTGSRVAESADGSQASGAPLLTITYRLGGNVAPSVDAGPDQTITLPAGATLDGTVVDDGLPNPPAGVTTLWSTVSGPGTVTFGNANAVDTTASFSAAGVYTLRLTVNDGQLVGSDELTVTVIGAGIPALAVTNSPVTYDGTQHAATVVGSVPGTVSGILYDGSPTEPVDAGSYVITADFVPDDTANYDSLSGAVAGTFVIDKAATATTVTCPAGPFTYTGAAIEPCTASVTGPGGLNQAVAVTYANNTLPFQLPFCRYMVATGVGSRYRFTGYAAAGSRGTDAGYGRCGCRSHSCTLHTARGHGVTNPEGLAYSPDAGVFLLSQGADAGAEQLTVAAVTPFDDLTATSNMAAGVADPVNSTVDAGRNRLLLLDSQAQQLIEVDIDLEGRVLPETMSRSNIDGLTLSDARGLYVDPDTSNLYILDNGARQIVVVRPGGEQSYGDILAAGADQAARISLAPLGDGALRGIAVHPLTGHIFVLGPEQARLYELSATGELISTYDLAHLGISTPRALIIARSADLTDAPTEMHVYVVDGGARAAALPIGANRLYLPGIFAGPDASTAGLETSTQARLAELTFEAVPDLASAVVNAVSAAPLLRTIDTSPFPAPDPSGIAYNSSTSRLVVSDAEVEEMAIYAGNNVYETSLSGSLQRSSNTLAFSSEPTGVAYNPLNNHTFFSDDDKKKVNEVDPKADGLINTGDDVVTSFDTSAFGSMDPEGVAYSPALNMLFIADGVNAEVYKVAPGPNGLFDGSDDLVTQFDTESLGITDPEGIEWNPDSGTLYVVGKPETDDWRVNHEWCARAYA